MTKVDNINFDNYIEEELFQIFSDSMGLKYPMANEILEVKKFKKWCKKNYNRIATWLNDILNRAQYALYEKGLITEIMQEEESLFGKMSTVKHQVVTFELIEEAIKLKGLKKFLLDFSTMPEKEFIDVHLWENYLIFAQLFGIAKKVEKQFSKIYPDFNKQAIINTDITIAATSRMSNICYSRMKVGLRMHSASNIFSNIASGDYSSGDGGRSYSSGGSSAGGSRGGGFR